MNRPILRPHEGALWQEFALFAQFCGGDPRPTDAQAWFDMRGVSASELEWMSQLFSTLSGVLRERANDDK